jgi:hypothetical protein
MVVKSRSRLNNAPSEVIARNVLQENPEGFEKAESPTIVVTPHLPTVERIIFRNERDPGIPLTFHYASKTHPLHHYTLYHDQEVTLPIEVIEHLESRAIPIYGYRRGPDGHPQMYQNGQKHQFTCKTIRTAR